MTAHPPALRPALGPESTPRRSIRSLMGLLLLVAVFLTPTGFIAYLVTSRHARQERASTSYVPIVATVVESGIVSAGRTRGWQARVTYRYKVDGHAYLSSRIEFFRTATSPALHGGPSRDDATAVAARLAVGSTLQAYYDPANPSEAVRDASPPSGSPLTTTLAFVVVAVLLGLLGVRTRGPRIRVSFPGPRIPEPLITFTVFVGCLASFAAGAWFIIRAVRGSAQDDAGTAFAFGIIGALLLSIWLHRRRTQRDAT
jgi:uncharacterized protein DUF3592